MKEVALQIPQYNVYKFSTFKFFTGEENELYNKYQGAVVVKDKRKAKEVLNDKIKSFSGIREIDEKHLIYKNQVSWFANDLTNRITDKDTKERSVIEDIIIIKVMHDDIFEQIMDNGFICKGKKYSFYTSGAGQQRKEMLTFVSEVALKKYNDFLMGGLSDNKINQNGGINIGKLLAYKALTMSAGIEIEIPLDKIIVVDDFETYLEDEVEYIDTNDINLPVTRRKMKVPVNHMDGAGMVLPNKIPGIKGNCQFRNKWCKGALVEFDFLKFSKNVARNAMVTDIYNNTYDIEKDDIWVILTRSQFKMAGHYENWKAFKSEMKRINSKFYICNIENPPQKLKQLSYQYLQTLDIPLEDKETIANLCRPTIDYIKRLHTDKDEALRALGATEDNERIKPLQEALLIYPELIQDEHVKGQIKKVVQSYKRDAMGGKILSQGFYSYIFPDIYAFCERLFGKVDNPKGIIPKNHVYNANHKDDDVNVVNLMRSPHLHPSEHCVRHLVKSQHCKDWFRGHATYVSVHDLAQLQMKNDVDGDMCFIGSNQDLIRNIRKDCYPLYYEMPKAPNQQINIENIKKTLKNAFKANKIGEISNALTKYLSRAYDEGFILDMNFIARLQAWNNFTIDFPKTGENIDLPLKDMNLFESLQYPIAKSPHFFIWAKNKKATAVDEYGNGVVDRISLYIKSNVRSNRYTYFDKNTIFNYAMLTNGDNVDRSSNKYKEMEKVLFNSSTEIMSLNKELSKMKKEDSDVKEFLSKFDITYQIYRDKMIEIFNGDISTCVNYLVDIEYCQEYRQYKSKNILWNCFGNELLNNIKQNINSNRNLKARSRFAYKKEKQWMEEIKKKLEEKIKPISIDITSGEYNRINSFKDNEKNLYFVLICLSKITKNNEIKLYKNIKSNKNKVTYSKLNQLAGISNAQNVLKKLEEKKIINKEKKKGYSVITIVKPDQSSDMSICFKVSNVWRPLVSLAKHEDKAIGNCEICGDEFIKKGSAKTCSDFCSKEQQRRNKQKNYQSKKKSA